ncbi:MULTISPECIES: IS66-like element accessory protein TnpA [Novosphingobium]|uniref:Transposase n=1 Tax=Novosphingobium mathurense TaxID=428990 RepID=A0A1U6IIW4_9SPHN|nr:MULTISPECIES: transposase [Novosphingobium]SLK07958.1 transposase [Novosphingobium mathurense]
MSDETDFETSFETNALVRPERLDVVAAPRGRRSWTPEARARIIAESLVPGVNVSEVARRHGIYPQQLYTWRRGFQEHAEKMRPDSALFVPAMVEHVEEPFRETLRVVDGEIVIETARLAIRIPAGVSADHIERVLLAVQANS